MTEDVYAEKLARFKRNENPEAVLLVADDPELMKAVVSWTSLDVRPVGKPKDPQEESNREVWAWLWANIEYSVDDLAEKSGLTAALVHESLGPSLAIASSTLTAP